jgi:hypothetical protein
MTLVSTVTVGAGGAASINFSSIPQTATDLLILFGLRCEGNDFNFYLRLNGDSGTNYSERRLRGTGAAVASLNTSATNQIISQSMTPSTYTASTFSNGSIYIPNYAGSAQKTVSLDSVVENNATDSYQTIQAGLWSSTAAVTSVNLTLNGFFGNFAQYSTASLYTITKGSGGATVS